MNEPTRLTKRNTAVRAYVAKLQTKYPQWRYDAIINKTAERYFLSKRTVYAIIKGEGIYAY